jgi:hypothetical protein
MIISEFPLNVKNQEFLLSRPLPEKGSGYFQIIFLMANKNQETMLEKRIKKSIKCFKGRNIKNQEGIKMIHQGKCIWSRIYR